MNAETTIIATTPPKREVVLAFIIEQIARYGIAPTFDEIGRHIGASKSRAHELVNQLVERGMIERTVGSQRSFRVVNMATSRELLALTLQRLGWLTAAPMGEIEAMALHAPLPLLPAFEQLPDVD